MTVGMREVRRKQVDWRRPGAGRAAPVSIVLGPQGRPYLIDQHHLVRALHEERVPHIMAVVRADFSLLDRPAFWRRMVTCRWVHPFDAEGQRHALVRLPRMVTGLADDPFRSLAGELRRHGGYCKDPTPFSEFRWADYLRRNMDREVAEKDCDRALKIALRLARSPQARLLPGWCGTRSAVQQTPAASDLVPTPELLPLDVLCCDEAEHHA